MNVLLVLLAAGRVTGTIAWNGPPVRPPKIIRTDAACKRSLVDPAVTLSKSNKALANVVVRVVAGARPSEPPADPIVITQRDCMYEPRVQGAVKGQHIVVKNADAAMHNVHAFVGPDDSRKTLFNIAQPAGAAQLERDPKDTLGAVHLGCDIHPWMNAFVVFSESAAFAVSDAEGKWSLELPAGTYTLEAWHEKYGAKTLEVKVEEGKPTEAGFSFK